MQASPRREGSRLTEVVLHTGMHISMHACATMGNTAPPIVPSLGTPKQSRPPISQLLEGKSFWTSIVQGRFLKNRGREHPKRHT